MTDTKVIELLEKAERRIFVPLECKDLLDQALAKLKEQPPAGEFTKECDDFINHFREFGWVGERDIEKSHWAIKLRKACDRLDTETQRADKAEAKCKNCMYLGVDSESINEHIDKHIAYDKRIEQLEAKLKDLLAACKELLENEPHGITPYFDEALRKIENILNKENSGEKRGK